MKSSQTPPTLPPEASERTDGPALIAFLGEDNEDSDFRLGTHEHDWHSHVRGQFFCVEGGLVHIRTAHGSWLLPPHRAGWIPPGVVHKASISGALRGWGVLIAPHACDILPTRPCVIGISSLMRALVQRAVSWAAQETLSPEQERILSVLQDEMRSAPHEPLHLPMPTDRRLLRVAQRILQHPGEEKSLEDWAAWAGLSARTLSRLCLKETGVSFAQWRQQAQLIHAMERLADGQSVAQVADALGYATPSNFIAMFRRSFGESPGKYFAEPRDSSPKVRAGQSRPIQSETLSN